MRSATWIGVSFLFLTGSPVSAQGVLFTATVTAPETDVRAKWSDKESIYATNRLRKGDRVEVIKDAEQGWYGIRPPAGSFSWINSNYVRLATPGRSTWIVNCGDYDPVPVLIGSSIRVDKPTIEGVKVRKGTQLRAVGSMKQSGDGNWLPVEAPPGEIRYIRASDITRVMETPGASVPPTTVPPSSPPSLPETPRPGGPPALPVATPGAVVAPPPTSRPTVPTKVDPRWLRAAEAEQAGRIVEAIQLYRDLATQVRNIDENLMSAAINRAQWLEDGLRKQNVAPTMFPANDARYPTASGPTNTSPVSPAALPAGMSTSSPGVLQRAGRGIDNRPTYYLMNNQGRPMLYAVPNPGISLEPYLNRTVELFGVLQQRDDVRAWLMVVSQVRVLQ